MRLVPAYPLLGKELTELAARRRTYALRVVYGALLFAAFSLAWRQMGEVVRALGPFGTLGQGRIIFQYLVTGQILGVMLLMPALAAGAVTQEKERGTLTLLLLTDLRPRQLLAQKYLSRLVAVGGFIALSIPLMAVALAFGGVSTGDVVRGVWELALTCLQTAAVAVAASCWCRGSAAAFVVAYLALTVLYLALPVLSVFGVPLTNWDTLCPLVLHWVLDSTTQRGQRAWMYSAMPPRSAQLPLDVVMSLFYGWQGSPRIAPPWLDRALALLAAGAPILLSTIIALVLARIALVRRADAVGGNLLLRLFRRLDRWFERADRIFGRRARTDLPDRAPVAWREFNRRSLANWRYLVRLLVTVGGGLVCVLTFLFLGLSKGGLLEEAASSISLGVLAMTGLLLVVLGANLVAGERAAQTLDVLLTTPLAARDILVQKMRALRRIGVALLMALMVVLAYQHVLFSDHSHGGRIGPLRDLFRTQIDADMWYSYYSGGDESFGGQELDLPWMVLLGATAAMILPQLTWLAVWIGLAVRNRYRAVIGAVVAAAAWCLGGLLIIVFLARMAQTRGGERIVEHAMIVSPLGLLALAGSAWRDDPWLTAAGWAAVQALIVVGLRHRCLRNAERYLSSGAGRGG